MFFLSLYFVAACDVIQRSAQPVTSQVNSNCTSSAVDSRNSNEVRSMIMELFDDVINEPEASKVPSTSTSTLDAPLGGDINAKLAISEIQKQLMSLDYPNNTGSVSGNSSSCAVSTMGQPTLVGGPQITNQQYRQMYPPPPAYSATGTIRQVSPGLTNTSGIGAQMGLLSAVQFPTKVIKHRPQPSNVSGGINNASIAATSPNQPMATATAVFAPNGMMQPNPIIIPNQSMMVNGPMSGPPPRMSKTLMERKQKALYQQMQQKQRLLAQQQQQQMTMQTPQHEPPFEPMNEVLLNNTVGPNVAIQPIPRQHSNTQAQLSPQVMNNPPNGPNMIGSFDPITGAPMSPRFKLMSNVIPHSPSPQPSLNAQMMAAQHSPSNQRSHSSASNPQGRGFSPSPSLASSSPHLSTNMTGSLMQTSSPHPYSPASPASGMLPHSNSSANPMQPNLASTAVGSPAGNWSPLPPPILRSSSNAMTAQNLAAQNAAQLANRMQQQNPMLNAQLSQGPVGFITNVTTSTNANNTAPLVSSGTAPNTPQPPNSPSPSLLGNMRYNRNSPVLSGTTTAGPVNNQYPLSPGFHGIHSPATPPMQSQPSQMQSMPNTQQQRTPVRNMPNARMPSSNMPNASGNNSGYFQNASTINSIPGNSFPATQTGYVNSEYVKQELRARVGARSLQNNQIQQQQQQQQQQQSSFGAMSHGGGMSLSSNVPQVRPGSATAVSPIGMFNSNHNNPVGMMSTPMHTNQLGSTLTPEDIDAVVLSFDLSEQMNSTPDSPLFNLGDLTDSPSMVSSSLNRSNSIGRSVRFD